jgi:hypothetical protein
MQEIYYHYHYNEGPFDAGSLYEIEIKQAHIGQITTYKVKLNAQLSLQRGGSILASNALDQKKVKLRKAARGEAEKGTDSSQSCRGQGKGRPKS